MCRTDDCLEIFLKRDFLLVGGDKGGGDRKRFGFSLKLVAPSLPSWCQQDRTPLDPLVWQSRSTPPRMAHTRTNVILSRPGSTHLSWPSLFLLFLLLRAILVLELFFRAGPILMEVFSRAVVRRATLFPL